MRTEHLCVLTHIRIKGEVGTVKLVYALWYFFTDQSKTKLLLWILFVIYVSCCPCNVVLSVPGSLDITCWKRTDLSTLLCLWCPCVFVPYGVLGQV